LPGIGLARSCSFVIPVTARLSRSGPARYCSINASYFIGVFLTIESGVPNFGLDVRNQFFMPKCSFRKSMTFMGVSPPIRLLPAYSKPLKCVSVADLSVQRFLLH
jgi:hypothetical protein